MLRLRSVFQDDVDPGGDGVDAHPRVRCVEAPQCAEGDWTTTDCFWRRHLAASRPVALAEYAAHREPSLSDVIELDPHSRLAEAARRGFRPLRQILRIGRRG